MPVPIPYAARRLVLGLALGLAFSLVPAASAADPTLYANYNTSCTFAFVGDNGAAVTTVAPGTYQLLVSTPFAFGNGAASCEYVQFHLTGPGVNLATDLGGGDLEVEQHTIALQAGGTYTVQDDARSAQTRRTFTVSLTGSSGSTGSIGSSTSSSSSTSSGGKGTPSKDIVGSAVLPFRGTLQAAVSASGKLTLQKAQKAVATLKAGRYTFRVADASNAAGFTVQLVKRLPKTLSTVTFKGAKASTVALDAGQWSFYTPGGARHFFIVTR